MVPAWTNSGRSSAVKVMILMPGPHDSAQCSCPGSRLAHARYLHVVIDPAASGRSPKPFNEVGPFKKSANQHDCAIRGIAHAIPIAIVEEYRRATLATASSDPHQSMGPDPVGTWSRWLGWGGIPMNRSRVTQVGSERFTDALQSGLEYGDRRRGPLTRRCCRWSGGRNQDAKKAKAGGQELAPGWPLPQSRSKQDDPSGFSPTLVG
jgi:hypothetical protein